MKKKYIYFLLGAFVFLTSVLLFAVLQQQSTISNLQKENAPLEVVTPANESSFPVSQTGDSQTAVYAQPTPTTEFLSPEQAAERFYRYYFSNPNPLARGAYKTNPYLSDEFKDVIGSLYKNGDKPVFCPQNQRGNITVGKKQEVYNVYGYLTQVVISETQPESKDLYRILLKNVNGAWFIYDINCIRN